VGNFQGTYVRPGNSWDLRSCTQKPGESLRDFIRRFSKCCTELLRVAQSEIVHAFLKGTTCRDLVRELGRNPPADSNELFDIATSFASGEEAVGAIFDGKKGKRSDDAPAEGSKSREPHRKDKRGKKEKKPRREAREQGRDNKMEAYCKAVRALEDKFYGIELNHVPRRYNEEADELSKIASGRITVPPNVFARDITQPSVPLEPHLSSHAEPSGAPSNPAGAEPMDEDPSNEAYVLFLLEGYGAYEADVMDVEPAPVKADWRDKYVAWMARGELPRTGPRPGASPGWPSPSPSKTASCTSAPPPASYSGACPFPRGASSYGIFTRGSAAITPHPAPS
jgi:hypothetical protein